MPGPTAPSFLEAVLSGASRVAAAHPELASISQEAVARVAAGLSADAVKAAARPPQLPIKFQDLAAEVNAIALHHLLDFGSGYDPAMKASSRRDVREALQFAVMGMHLSVARGIDAAWMKAFNSYSVANFFGLEAREDHPVPNLPGVTMSRPGPLQPLATMLEAAVKESGEALDDLGHRSLGHYITELATDLHRRKHPRPAAAIVAELADGFAAFQDSALCDGARVTFARKAQNLVGALAARFSEEDERFAFPDAPSLTADSGATTTAVLRHLGVLQLCEGLASAIDAGQEVPQGLEERVLRAATIAAVQQVTAAANSATGSAPLTPYELSCYLCLQAEEGQPLHGKVQHHLTTGTTAY